MWWVCRAVKLNTLMRRSATEADARRWFEQARWPDRPICPRCGVMHRSSQTCSGCDYVDEKNRAGETFSCGWCGRTLHADVNASRNLRARRSRPTVGSVKQSKAAALRAQAFQRLNTERMCNPKGRRGTSRDPRGENAYFRRYAPEVTSSRAGATSAPAACAIS